MKARKQARNKKETKMRPKELKLLGQTTNIATADIPAKCFEDQTY
jgi:hypothetical protein